MKLCLPLSKIGYSKKIAFDLTQYHCTSATFTLNLLRGTPSIILCDRHLQILDRWFGYESDPNIRCAIDKYMTGDRQ
jgi:hypothetical protein